LGEYFINIVEKVKFTLKLTIIANVAAIGASGFVISYLAIKYKRRLKVP